MTTREIPRDDWIEFCKDFSRMYDGWLVNVQVQGAGIQGGRYEAKDLPFHGISYEEKGPDHDNLVVFVDRGTQEDVTRTVDHPTHFRVEQKDDGTDQGLEIEAQDGTKTIVQFVHPRHSGNMNAM